MLSPHIAKALCNVKIIGADNFPIMRNGNLVRKIEAAPQRPLQSWFDRSPAIKENFPVEIMHAHESVNTHLDKIAIKLSR
jgi:hypothetical protein